MLAKGWASKNSSSTTSSYTTKKLLGKDLNNNSGTADNISLGKHETLNPNEHKKEVRRNKNL